MGAIQRLLEATKDNPRQHSQVAHMQNLFPPDVWAEIGDPNNLSTTPYGIEAVTECQAKVGKLTIKFKILIGLYGGLVPTIRRSDGVVLRLLDYNTPQANAIKLGEFLKDTARWEYGNYVRPFRYARFAKSTEWAEHITRIAQDEILEEEDKLPLLESARNAYQEALETEARKLKIARRMVELAQKYLKESEAYCTQMDEWATTETKRLWRPWRGWRVRYRFAGDSKATHSSLILDNPSEFANADPPYTLSIVSGTGARELAKNVAEVLPEYIHEFKYTPDTRTEALYHRSYTIENPHGRWVVNVHPKCRGNPTAPPEDCIGAFEEYVIAKTEDKDDLIPSECLDPDVRMSVWMLAESDPEKLAENIAI